MSGEGDAVATCGDVGYDWCDETAVACTGRLVKGRSAAPRSVVVRKGELEGEERAAEGASLAAFGRQPQSPGLSAARMQGARPARGDGRAVTKATTTTTSRIC